MKPNTRDAMAILIAQIKAAFPFDMPDAQLCAGKCLGCSKKLLEYLSAEIDGWHDKLACGETPTLRELSSLAKRSKKIYQVLARNELV